MIQPISCGTWQGRRGRIRPRHVPGPALTAKARSPPKDSPTPLRPDRANSRRCLPEQRYAFSADPPWRSTTSATSPKDPKATGCQGRSGVDPPVFPDPLLAHQIPPCPSLPQRQPHRRRSRQHARHNPAATYSTRPRSGTQQPSAHGGHRSPTPNRASGDRQRLPRSAVRPVKPRGLGSLSERRPG